MQNSSECTPFTYANGCLTIAKELKGLGADVDAVDEDGRTLLTRVCRFHPDSVKDYLKLGCDLNKGSEPPLLYAITSANFQMVELLLAAGADPFQILPNGSSLINEAILRASPKILEALFAHPKLDPNQMDKNGMTPLTSAIYIGNLDDVRELYRKGAHLPADLSGKARKAFELGFKRMVITGDALGCAESLLENEKGERQYLETLVLEVLDGAHVEVCVKWINASHLNPLILGEHLELFAEMIEKGLAPRLSEQSLNDLLLKVTVPLGGHSIDEPSSAADETRSTMSENSEIVKWLVSQGADLNGKDLKTGATIFAKIAEFGHIDLIKWCLAQSTIKRVSQTNSLNLLSVATRRLENDDSTGEIYRALVTFGMDQNALCQTGSFATPFSSLVYRGNLNLLLWGLEHGALVCFDNPHRKLMPLHAAAHSLAKGSRKESVLALLDAKADIHERDSFEHSPLTYALFSGDSEVVQVLFDRGAVLRGEKDIESALINAISSGNIAAVRLLKERGFTIPSGLVDEKGLLARGYRPGNHAMLDLLLKETVHFKIDPEDKKEFWGAMIAGYDFTSFQKLIIFKDALQEDSLLIQEEAAKAGKQVYFKKLEAIGIKIDAKKTLEGYKLKNLEGQNVQILDFLFQRLDNKEIKKEVAQYLLEDAIALGSIPVIKFLFANQADANQNAHQKVEQPFPLFAAIKTKNPLIVKYLLDHQANPVVSQTVYSGPGEITSGKDMTAMKAAKASGSQEIFKMIKDRIHR